jgi:hypothetical protein
MRSIGKLSAVNNHLLPTSYAMDFDLVPPFGYGSVLVFLS